MHEMPYRYRDVDDDRLLSVCKAFLDELPIGLILDQFNDGTVDPIKRENVYPLLREARKRGYFDVHPPANRELKQRLVDSFGLEKDQVSVLSTRGRDALDYVAKETARVILRLVLEVGESKDRVHIGLGGGTSVMRVARELALLMSRHVSLPDLSLHALTSGFDVTRPQTAPVMFFGYFDQLSVNITYVGLFAQAVVRQGQYKALMEDPRIAQSFDNAKDIDIVVTSLASAHDKDGELTHFLKVGKAGKVTSMLKKRGWRGDVLYRPYAATEPITLDSGERAISIFELDDLVRLAATPNKHVVLIGGPCNLCGRAKGDALKPLFLEKKLKLWSHVVMDMGAAQILLEKE
jgi:DNA-binding transcriptional regulator LsrR (DeoR family)